jgi:hypothetical protein
METADAIERGRIPHPWTPKHTRSSFVLSLLAGSLLIASIPATKVAFANTSVFFDDFATLNTDIWEPAAQLPWFVGVPEVVATLIEGRTVLELTMQYGGNSQRVGYQTRESFALSDVQVEAAFRTLGPPGQSIDGLIELYLFDPASQSFIVGHVHFGSYANLREARFRTSMGPSAAQVLNETLVYDRWYRILVEAGDTSCVMSFFDDSTSQLLWQSPMLSVGLTSLGPTFHVCFAQYLHTPGPGSWIAHAALDWIELDGGSTPVVPSTWGQVKSTFMR